MIRTIQNKRVEKKDTLDFSKLHESRDPRLQEYIASQKADVLNIPKLKNWKMRSLQERLWKYQVPEDIAKKFSKAIHADNPDFEEIRKNILAILNFVKESVGEDDFYEDSLLEDVEFADLETEDDVDYYIDEMYDTLDGYSVWMTPASWFDDDEDDIEEDSIEEDDIEEEDEEDFVESKTNKDKLTESLSSKDLHNVFVETVYDWKESGEKISPRLKDFSRKVIAGCILDDDEALKKIAYDYADVQEIAPPLYDALMNHLKSDNLKESKMKESEDFENYKKAFGKFLKDAGFDMSGPFAEKPVIYSERGFSWDSQAASLRVAFNPATEKWALHFEDYEDPAENVDINGFGFNDLINSLFDHLSVLEDVQDLNREDYYCSKASLKESKKLKEKMSLEEAGYTSEDLEAWFNKIDLQPVVDHVKQLTGFDVTFDKKVASYRSSLARYPEIISKENLAEMDKAISAAWKEFRVANYGSDISLNEDGKLYLWLNIHYTYVHRDGGSNGAELFNCWYSDDKGWIFRDSGSR